MISAMVMAATDLPPWLSVAFVGLGIAVALIVAATLAKSRVASQTLTFLQAANDAQANRIAELERQLAEEQAHRARLDEELEALRRLVTGQGAIEALGQQMAEYHKEVMQAIGDRRNG